MLLNITNASFMYLFIYLFICGITKRPSPTYRRRQCVKRFIPFPAYPLSLQPYPAYPSFLSLPRPIPRLTSILSPSSKSSGSDATFGYSPTEVRRATRQRPRYAQPSPSPENGDAAVQLIVMMMMIGCWIKVDIWGGRVDMVVLGVLKQNI